MGPRWANETDQAGRRRLEDPGDFVRLEILAALRSEVRIIPVLIAKSEMPATSDLPEPLRPLAHRNAFEIRDDRFRSDTDRLVTIIREGAHRPGLRVRSIVASLALCIGSAA